MNCPLCERLATSVYDEDFGYSWYCKPCEFGFRLRIPTDRVMEEISTNTFHGVIRHVDTVLKPKERKIDEKR